MSLAKNMEELVSIIAPVYNVSKYLNQFIESILAQTYSNFELILVDDCSTDNSLEICYQYAKNDSRIKVIHQKQNGGAAIARDIGLQATLGKYIMYADSDDYLPENAVEILYSLLRDTKADVSGGCMYHDYNGCLEKKRIRGMKEKIIFNREKAIKKYLNCRMIPGYVWGKMYRAEVLRGLDVVEDIVIGEDGVLTIQVLNKIKKIVLTNKYVYVYRQRTDSVSGHGSDYSERDMDVFKQGKYVKEIIQDRKFFKQREVFLFNLYNSNLKKYEKSTDVIREQYKKIYIVLREECDKRWLRTFLYSSNLRIKLEALKYKCKYRIRI